MNKKFGESVTTTARLFFPFYYVYKISISYLNFPKIIDLVVQK